MVSHADVLIRRYETKDYGFVCKLFYECLIENWIPAYRLGYTKRGTFHVPFEEIRLDMF